MVKMRRDEETGGFKYQKRTKEQVHARATQGAGQYDNPTLPELPTWWPKAGDACVRFMPAGWDDASHYGYDIWVHGWVGSDKANYLCLEKHEKGNCPICQERVRVEREAAGIDENKGPKAAAKKKQLLEYARKLRPTRKVLVWVIDRNTEQEGPKLWAMPWTLDRDISAISEDKRSGEVLAIDLPDEGYDVEFTKKGQGLGTEYIGAKVARRPSPISESSKTQAKWLKFISSHPLPDCLRWMPEERIRKAFESGSPDATLATENTKKPETRSEREMPKKKKVKKFKSEKKFKKRDADEGLDDPEPKKKLKKKLGLKSKIKSGLKGRE